MPEPVNEPVARSERTITPDQVAELRRLAKLKGYTTKEAAIAFLNEQAMGDFTAMLAGDYDAFKKLVTGAGWKKPDATHVDAGEVPF